MSRRTTVLVGLVSLAATWAAAGEPPGAARVRQAARRMFQRQDKNGDGKLTRDEFPQRAIGLFDRIDRNKDRAVTMEEDVQFRLARQAGGRRPGPRPPAPDHADVEYGPHARNVLDLWLAKSDAPTPLVIYYHGGGFRGGDKRTINPQLLTKLREARFGRVHWMTFAR